MIELNDVIYEIDAYGSIYEYDAAYGCYLFFGKKLPDETDIQAIQRIKDEIDAKMANGVVYE